MSVLEEFEQVELPRRWRPGGRVVTGFFGVLTVLDLVYGTLRLISLDGFCAFDYLIVALTFTPYVVAAGAVLGLFMIIIGRRKLAFVLLCVTLVLASLVSPRLLRNEQPDASGQIVRILSANLRLGQADPAHLVELVRTNRVQILAMQELSPAEASELDTAGLAELMPYRVYIAEPGGSGSGIASVYPLRQLASVPDTTFQMPIAVVDLPGNQDAEVVDVHAKPPVDDFRTWRSELFRLPSPLPLAGSASWSATSTRRSTTRLSATSSTAATATSPSSSAKVSSAHGHNPGYRQSPSTTCSSTIASQSAATPCSV